MDNFYTIRFKRATARRFKSFSKKVSKSYSVSMELIIDFFEWHGFSPSERFEKSLGRELVNNRKRTEAAIAIIRVIEKQQTKPTMAMLQLLFEHSPQKTKKPKLVEVRDKDTPKTDEFFKSAFETIELERRHTELLRQYGETQNDLNDLIQKVQVIKGGFGKTRLQLDMNLKEFEALKATYKID